MLRYKQPFRLCVRNKILRSANAKYHYSYLLFYKVNKGDLPLVYSWLFLVWIHRFSRGFFWLLLSAPVTLLIIRSFKVKSVKHVKTKTVRIKSFFPTRLESFFSCIPVTCKSLRIQQILKINFILVWPTHCCCAFFLKFKFSLVTSVLSKTKN